MGTLIKFHYSRGEVKRTDISFKILVFLLGFGWLSIKGKISSLNEVFFF